MRIHALLKAAAAATALFIPPVASSSQHRTAAQLRPPGRAYADVSRSLVCISPRASSVERLAARMLVEEAAKRSGVKLRVVMGPVASGPAIYLGSRQRVPPGCPRPKAGAPGKPEGYRLIVSPASKRAPVVALGNDERGCMFAAGRLLREMRCEPRAISLPTMDLDTAPANRVRGHQLGWRPASNTYDKWGLKEYEQYIRDLILWGTNAIELIPFDTAYPRDRNMRFTCQLADLIHSYGLQVWLWYPLDDTTPAGMTGAGLTPGQTPCPSQADGRKFILDRRREFFAAIKHLDAVFIPGGDPAGCPCDRCKPWVRTMLPLCAEIAAIVHEHHPKAGMWISNQGFRGKDNQEFYAYLRTKQPKWLAGLVAGPWAEETIPSMRAHAPREYPIRLYPDICHCVRCQYPAKEWDQAFASTLGREPPIYRPTEHARIARMYQPVSCGAVTYSDGINDDLNKAIWSALLWDPAASLETVLLDYGRCYVGERYGARVLRGIRGLEADWRAPTATNRGIENTYRVWTEMEKDGGDALAHNWRFQMALMRATYDAYVQRRLAKQRAVEQTVYAALRTAGADEQTVPEAVAKALAVLADVSPETEEPELRARLLELGQTMFDAIGMQLSVERWGASGKERGAIMDYLDAPLANLDWLKSELTRLQVLSNTGAIRAGIARILDWESPGPGGYYDDLGDPTRQPHLVHQKAWQDDPGYVESPRCDFAQPFPGARISWLHYAETLYGTPLVMRYSGLDPHARYVLRATYSGRYRPTMTLTANGKYQVHGPIKTVVPPVWQDWPIPVEATRTGTLELRWDRTDGRGCQVAEVWLMKR